MAIQIKDVRGKVIAAVQNADSVGHALEILALLGASLPNADLRGVNVSGRNLRALQCPNADFSGATLNGAKLTEAHLAGCNFTAAQMMATHFAEAKLAGATFKDVDPRGVVAWPRDIATAVQFQQLKSFAGTDPRSVDFPVASPTQGGH